MNNLTINRSSKPGYFRLIAFFGLSILLASCAKMPIYKSKTVNETGNAETRFNEYFGQKNSVGYVAGHNDSTLFLKVEFQNLSSLMKIMQGGLEIYFDPSGKKKKNISLKLERNAGPNRQGMQPMPGRIEEGRQQQMENMLFMVNSSFPNATWSNPGNNFTFNKNTTHKPIDAGFVVNEKGNCVFNLSLPLSEIPLQSGQDILTIGIKTNAETMQGFGGQSAGGGPGGGGGGMPGGGPGGGGMPGGGGNTGGQGPGGQASIETINIWFQMQL